MKKPTEKSCARCREVLPASAFDPNPKLKSGLHTYCKECRKAKNADRPKNKRDEGVVKACTVCKEVLGADHYMSNVNSKDGLRSICKECSVVRQIVRKYKITVEQYEAMLADGCTICGSHDNPQIDHDHSCCPGQTTCGLCVRGLLCRTHNLSIGHFDNNTGMAHAAEVYLEYIGRYNKQRSARMAAPS